MSHPIFKFVICVCATLDDGHVVRCCDYPDLEPEFFTLYRVNGRTVEPGAQIWDLDALAAITNALHCAGHTVVVIDEDGDENPVKSARTRRVTIQ